MLSLWLSARLALAVILLTFAAMTHATAPSPLDGFDPNANNVVRALALQPDGKVLVGGYFTQIGTTRNHIARLNVDGSLDTTFNPGTGANDTVQTLAIQADGKVLLGGWFTTINGTARNRIARLNTDGSLDTTFNPGSGANDTIQTLAIQANGKVLLGGWFTTINGTACNRIARLNADGSLDTTFNPGSGALNGVYTLAVQPDGKVLLGGFFSIINGTDRDGIARLNTDGSLDATFNPGADIYGNGINIVFALLMQPDGKILLGGDFFNSIARLNADDSADATFNPGTGANYWVHILAMQPDGKVLLGGEFVSINGTRVNYIARLNANGSLDTTFNPGTGANDAVYALALQADGKLLLGGDFTSINGTVRHFIARLNADGSLDANFNAATGAGANNAVDTVAVQPDGKSLLGGDFTQINGTARNRIARLNIDGSLDVAFNPGTGADSEVFSLAMQPDGKILLGGAFTSINGTTHIGIARLNANGSLDSAFNPIMSSSSSAVVVRALTLQPDGKILLGGAFNTINSSTRNGVARLNADGSLDLTFNPSTGANNGVYTLALQPDGKLLLGGIFTSINGTGRNRVARLNPNGTLDSTFNPGTGANSDVNALLVQADGKVLLDGAFTTFNGVSRNRIARLNADGTLDTTFNIGTGTNGTLFCLALQADGKVILGGWFSTFNDSDGNRIARLFPDGSPDVIFNSGIGVDNNLTATALQADGKILLGGDFTYINGMKLHSIARLSNPDAALQSLSVSPGGKSVTWSLGGSFPQPYQVLFEHSTDGAAWTALGWGVAVPRVGYRLSGLSLPLKTNHYLRATGWMAGGSYNGSVSLHRSVLRFYTTPLPQFTLTYIAGAHGSIDGATSVTQTVDQGTSGTAVRAVPDAGYQFTTWSDGLTANPRTDAGVTTNIMVMASFARSAALSPSRPSLSFLEGSGRAVDVEKGGAPTTQSLTLTNTGELPLTFTGGATGTPGLALTGRCAADYAIQSVTPSTANALPASTAVTVVIRFAPRAATRTLGLDASLAVTSNSPLTPALSIPLLGDAVPVGLASFGVR